MAHVSKGDIVVLLRLAEESEDAAAGLVRFRDSLPHNATHITAVISKLFAISAVLRRIHSGGEGRPRRHVDDDDLTLLFSTIKITNADILETFSRRDRPDQTLWEELSNRMEHEERFDLIERLEWYREALDAMSRDVQIPSELRRDLQDLLEAQAALRRRRRGRRASFGVSGGGATTPRPRRPPSRPALHHVETPVSPTIISDEWDAYTTVDRPPPVMAPEPPLSPTFSSSSSHTLSSSQTSYSNIDPYLVSRPAPSSPMHWAQNVFNGDIPVSTYGYFARSDAPSECFGNVEPQAISNLSRDGFQPVLKLPFDRERLWIQFYWRSRDHRARILIQARDSFGRPLLFCTPLTNLKIIRDASCLQLCRAASRRSSSQYTLWARLNFFTHERMVLFYSTFVAMKRQDGRHETVPGDLREKFELENDDAAEEVLFSGEIRHAEMVHAIRLYVDHGSGVIRLEASPLRGPKKDVPIWTAFVTKYVHDPDHVQYEGGGVVSFAAIKPAPAVFVLEYEPPRNRRNSREYILPFTSEDDSSMFMETWASLQRQYGRRS